MTTPHALRASIARLGISQNQAARLVGISARQMRAYLADPETASTAVDAPAYIGLALDAIEARLAACVPSDEAMAAAVSVPPGHRLRVWAGGRWSVTPACDTEDTDAPPIASVAVGEDACGDPWTAEYRDHLADALRADALYRLELAASA